MGVIRRLRLNRFTPADTKAFLGQALGGPVDPNGASVMHAQAEGVPFIVEEMAFAYREAGMIQQIDGKRRMVILLPGPPFEMKPMFERQVMPLLREFAPPSHFARRMLRLAMIPESQADAIAAPIYKKRVDVQTTILANAGEVQFHLLASGASESQAQAKVDSLADELDAAFGSTVYSTEGEPLEEIVGLHLGMRGLTIAVAESCTGGMLGQRLTSLPGSSRWFVGGAIVYSNELKTRFCGVPAELIAQHGAVSEEVAPWLDLVRKLGLLFGTLSPELPTNLSVQV